MSNYEREKRAREKAFFLKPVNWPRYPVMPVVKRGGEIGDPDRCAVVMAGELKRVYFGINIFRPAEELRQKLGRQPTWGDVLDGARHQDYASVDELLSQWRLD